MGEVRFKGKLVYSGPICKWEFKSNWCDSMATYYPYIVVHYLLPDGILGFRRVDANELSDPKDVAGIQVVLDTDMVDEMKRLDQIFARKLESKNINMHNLVKVVKGRKVPIGTEGEVCWMGLDGFGNKKVGIRLKDGSRVYTATSNVENITDDEIFEREFLGKN